MLKHLSVRNFKALQALDISLKARNIFIGRNNSGKSSILQALHCIGSLVTNGNVTNTFNGIQGFQQHLSKGVNGQPTQESRQSQDTISFDISGDTQPTEGPSPDPVKFQYSIDVGLDPLRGITIKREILRVEKQSSDIVLIDARNGLGTARRLSGEVLFKDTASFIKPFLGYEIPGWEADEVRKYIGGWQFFQFIPELAKATTASASALPFLDPQGAQLSAWLFTFQSNYPDAFSRIVSLAKEAFPEIESLSTPVTQAGMTFLAAKETGLISPINIIHASDGEIKFLQLLSVIFSPFPVSLVGVEEPESYLHPRLIELLVEAADTARIENGDRAAQIFATTHSTYLIDKLDPADVVVVNRVDGATQCVRVEDKTDIRRMLEEGELSFGRLWYSGALGGV